MSTVTVHDAIQFALPHTAQVLAGHAGLSRSITWPVLARAVAPLFTELNGNEIALISVQTLRDVDPPIPLAMLVERLATVPVSAVVVVGTIDATTVATAERHILPLVALASDVDIRELDRSLQRFLSDFEGQIERRAAQIALELGELSLAGGGLSAMVSRLGGRVGRAVALFSSKNDLLAFHGSADYRSMLQTIAIRDGDQRINAVDVWCLPLLAAQQVIGTIMMLGGGLTTADRTTVKRAGTALALELSKTQALSAVEERYRGNFLEQVLGGVLIDATLMQQRAREYGIDLRRLHTAVLCVVPSTHQANALVTIPALLPVLASTVPHMPHATGVLCMLPIESLATLNSTFILQTFRDVISRFPHTSFVYGRPVAHPSEWQQSVRDAEMTLPLLTSSHNHVLGYSDIGVYQLLLPILTQADAVHFHRHHLGLLLDYEQDPNGELLLTLEAYFACNGNLARTAEHIHVHRNTLLYRLTRIAQICHVDLDDAETRLSLWLAIKLHRLLMRTPPA